MRPARATIAAISILVLLLAGCGPFGGKSEQDKAGEVLTELVDARNEGDYARVCELIAAPDLAKFKRAGVSCEKTIRQRFGATASTTIRIEEVKVKGDRASVDATVSQTGGAGFARTFRLVKEDGDWKFLF
jgi:PBP1b-binding outer membrane lipoprotein LpoB